jgi:hypothetical protein
MSSVEPVDSVPWQRVVNYRGMVSKRSSGNDEDTQIQRALLESEGVEFSESGRIDLESFGWCPPRDLTGISRLIRARLVEMGAGLVGFADLSGIGTDLPMCGAISIAAPLDPGVVAGISSGPTLLYGREYDRVNSLLVELAGEVAALMEGEGHRALPLDPTTNRAYTGKADSSTPIPHKTAATLAGLGWIGRCALLVTLEYGSAVRLCTVLTDAEIGFGAPEVSSRCGDCRCCVEACPGEAVTGREWHQGCNREDIYDYERCRSTARGLSRSVGMERTICGICIASCPFTRAYISRGS